MTTDNTSQSPAILMDKVCKSFGKKKVLDNISVRGERGRVIGLLGRNGEGKTTLMRTLLDIEPIDSGSISVLGMSPDGSGELKKKVGYVPEKPNFHTFLNAREVMEYRKELLPGWDWDKAEAQAKTLEFDLSTPIQGASKGTLAKIAWICATAFNPELLLLDEPTEGLDALVRSAVSSELIRELVESGNTILMANHRMEELGGLLDEIWVMKNGGIPRTWEMQELRENGISIMGRAPGGKAEPPPGVTAVALDLPGDLVCWHTLEKDALDQVRSKELLSDLKVEKLPLQTTISLLLQDEAPTP